ncbi:MAG: pyridoxamine kinase [Hallerella sp.]|jgi:pyridoxine kinase|nr:pyridoxamine kinase [Hallerella sp.]
MTYPYKRVLTIQDISCVGQCSLTVALPIISACGLETAVLPSAVLSTHTGGFKGFTFRDLTDDLPKILEHWKKENIQFDAFYTGYLGSAKQIAYVRDILHSVRKKESVNIIDPAMADNGRLYVGFDSAFVEAMKPLIGDADYVLPNITEAALLTGNEYRETYDEKYILKLSEGLVRLGAKTVVLTGVSYSPETTGVSVYANGQISYYAHRKISKGSHGTGDVYASSFVGALLRGKSPFDSAKIAADYTVQCIENTIPDDSHWYGVKFETALPQLIASLNP